MVLFCNISPNPVCCPEIIIEQAKRLSHKVGLISRSQLCGERTGSLGFGYNGAIVKKTNRSVAVAVSTLLGVGSACAGELPSGVYNWTGVYGGVAGGYGWGHSDQTDPGIVPPPAVDTEGAGDGHFSLNGGLLGGTLGYNRQFGPWVLGLEGDLSWANIKGQSNVCGPTTVAPHPCGTKLDALGTFRGRVGYATGANGNWLLYATGGLAIGDVVGWDSLTPAYGSDWRAGWTAGVGIETSFAPNWTAKLEYLHVDLGNAQLFNIVPGVPESVGFSANILRAGINYKLGGPAAPQQFYTKAPYTKAPPIAGNGWSGWYAGLNAGYLDGSNKVNSDASVTSNSTTPVTAPAMASGATSQLSTGQGGFIGGAQAGYNHMISPMVLAGFEADIQGSSLRGNASASSQVLTDTVSGPNTGSWLTNIAASRSLDYIGTIRGRLGATVTPSLLLYVTGGLAYGGAKSSTTINQTTAISGVPANATLGSFSAPRAGYTVGGGAEWMFLSNWSAKAEYLYYDLGSANYGTGGFAVDEGPTSLPGFGIAAIATSTRVHFNGNIVRVGVNYHFN
nr:outer membrane beta-barrel protein [Bradyrhizobium sp. 1]